MKKKSKVTIKELKGLLEDIITSEVDAVKEIKRVRGKW